MPTEHEGWYKSFLLPDNILLVVVLNFYLAPLISDTFNIFFKIQTNVLFLYRKIISPNIITWWSLSWCPNSFVSYLVISESSMPGLCLHLKSDQQQLCALLLVQRPGSTWKSRKPSVSHVIWATGMNHEPVNCGREDKPWHIQALRLKNTMAETGMFCLRFLSVLFNATYEFRSEWNQVWKLKLRTLRYLFLLLC